MRLELIRKLSEKRAGGLKKLSADIGMSEANLHRCINNNKIQASDLEKIASIFEVPISTFFDDGIQTNAVASGDHSVSAINSHVSVSESAEISQLRAENELLKNQLQWAQDMIVRLTTNK